MRARTILGLFLVGASSLLSAQVCGDCDGNGAVSITDALKAAQITGGLVAEQPGDLAVCDADDSGAIAILDALRIAQSAVGLMPALRCPGSPANQPPAVVNVIPALPAAADVFVDYVLQDAESNSCSILISISTDGGATFPIAATNAPGGDGTSLLGSSPGGVAHDYAWDSLTDLGAGRFTSVVVRIAGSDGLPGPPGDSAPFTVDNSPPATPPEANSLAVAGGSPATGDVTINYLLLDAQADAVSITVDISTDGGTSFPITAADGAGGDGRAGLGSSPGGAAHSYVWDSAANLGAVLASNIVLRITPNDGQVGVAGATPPFMVDNRPPNNAPVVQFLSTPGMASGDVSFTYILSDAESDLASIAVTVSTDGGISFPVTAIDGVGGDGRMMLATSPGGSSHTYVWDSVTTLGMTLEATVALRITPSDGQTGTAENTMTFSVDNRPPAGVSYSMDLLPTILMTSPASMGCMNCHAGMFPSGGLNLETYAGLMAGGGSGAVVIPGDPGNSRIICKLEGFVCGSQMPRGRPAWTAPMLMTFRDWISQGALDN